MISNTEKSRNLIKDLDQKVTDFSETSPDWLKELCQKNLNRFKTLGLPSVKDEEWKYTNLETATRNTYQTTALTDISDQAQFNRYRDKEDINVVFINGSLSAELSDISNLPAGLTLCSITEALKGDDAQIIKSLLERPSDNYMTAFRSLNRALFGDGIFIKVDAKAVIKPLIHIIHITEGSGTFSQARALIHCEKSSEVTVLQSHLGFDDKAKYFSNVATDIYLAENAVCHYCKAQSEGMSAAHIGNTFVCQEQNSNFDGFSLMTGGNITRNNLDIILDGEGCNSTLNGLYANHEQQHTDNHTSVDHRYPNCNSTQLYKGILNGASRAVFNGKIFVRKIAQLTNSYQLNKNLLLGKNCRVDTKPQLEINADDVKCTHGATIGQLNEEELFYMQTRMISRKKAVSMLSHGFVDDILITIKSKSIHQKLNILLEPIFAEID